MNIHLYRPFPVETFVQKLPHTVKQLLFLIEVKNQGQVENLLLDVQSALYDSELRPAVIGGRYGLGSKDVTRPNLSSF